MQIYEISITKSVTRQVRQYEPMKVEATVSGQLKEEDCSQTAIADILEHVDYAIAAGFGEPATAPAGKTSVGVEEAKPAKKKRRTKAEIEADKLAEAEDTADAETVTSEDVAEVTEALEDTPAEDMMDEAIPMDDPAPEEPGTELTDEQVMEAVNKVIPKLKPRGVRTVMANFKVPVPGKSKEDWPPATAISSIQAGERAEFVKMLADAAKKVPDTN